MLGQIPPMDCHVKGIRTVEEEEGHILYVLCNDKMLLYINLYCQLVNFRFEEMLITDTDVLRAYDKW
jgi:hypothetical protein